MFSHCPTEISALDLVVYTVNRFVALRSLIRDIETGCGENPRRTDRSNRNENPWASLDVDLGDRALTLGLAATPSRVAAQDKDHGDHVVSLDELKSDAAKPARRAMRTKPTSVICCSRKPDSRR